jgi:hypothetical protein
MDKNIEFRERLFMQTIYDPEHDPRCAETLEEFKETNLWKMSFLYKGLTEKEWDAEWGRLSGKSREPSPARDIPLGRRRTAT